MFSLPTFTFAQLVKIGAGGGITQVLAPDGFTNEVSEGGLGYSTEWNGGLIGKVGLPLIPFTPRAFILYHSFTGSGESYPGEQMEYTQTVLEVGAGVQYNFIPTPLGFDPYIALDLAFNKFGDFEGIPPTSEEGPEPLVIPTGNRFGGGIGLGTEVTIIPLINLDFYLSYKMFNLTGKEEGEETVSAVTLDAFIIFNFL
jgi:hypothetical protein